jgi:circadian clock protein KaiC
MANVRSVGIDIAAYEATGELAALSLNPNGAIADDHYLRIERFARLHRPTLLVIDPISAFEEAGGREVAQLVVERFATFVKSHGITAIFTAIASSQIAEIEGTAGHVSSIADSWIHLNFAVKGGERNRTLTIVKSRGTAHSNQLREMVLGSGGITLQDVYQIQGEFLVGTARLEREQEEKRAQQFRELRERNEQRKLEERQETVRARLRDAQRELDEISERMTAGAAENELFEAGALLDRSEVLIQRGGNTIE